MARLRRSSYKPSSSFWSPSNLGGGPNPYLETKKIAEKLKPLSKYQRKLLWEASSAPWDFRLQIYTQNALKNQVDPLFPRPPAVTEKDLRDIRRLEDHYILFVPSRLRNNLILKAVLEKQFIYSGDFNGLAVFYADKLLGSHGLIVGQSGSGKTVKGQMTFISARNQGRWAFIHSKSEEWEVIIPELIAQGANPAMPRQWRVNPLAVFGNAVKSKEHFCHLFCEIEGVRQYSRAVFEGVIDKTYSKFGAYTKPLPLSVNPTFADLKMELKEMEGRENKTVIRTLITKVTAWERQFGNWAVPWDIEELARRTILFPLSVWSEKWKRIFVERLQGPLFAIREESRTTKEKTLLLHEEGRLVYCGKSQMAEETAQMRAEGLRVYCMVQSTRDLSPVLPENTAIKALGPVGHPSIARQMAEAMGLTKEHLEQLRHLPVGSFIETYMYGYPYPVLVRSPFKRFRNPTEEELYQAEHALDDMKTKSFEAAHRIEMVIEKKKEQEIAQHLGDIETEFLLGINEQPFLTTVERFEHHALNVRRGNELKKWCVDHGLIEEKKVPLGLGGVPVLLQLTSKAQELLGLPIVNQQLVHLYAENIIEHHANRFGANATPEADDIDMLIEVEGLRIAVEVEVSGTKAIENLRKNSECDKIIFVSIGAAAKRKLKKKLVAEVKLLGLEQKVVFLTLGQVVKSDCPIWLISP